MDGDGDDGVILVGDAAPVNMAQAVQVNDPVAVAVMVEPDEDDEDALFFAQEARAQESISPLLYDTIRTDCICTFLLSGWLRSEDQCTRQVNHCQDNPEEAFYTSELERRTVLHEACLRRVCIHTIQALLTANQNAALENDAHGNMPMHLLFSPQAGSNIPPTSKELEVIVDALLEVNPTRQATSTNRSGKTPLHIACSHVDSSLSPSVIEKLITANPECASTLDSNFATALHLYCNHSSASVAVTEVLFEAYPAAAERTDRDGNTPLHLAASKGNTDLVCFLAARAPQSASIHSQASAPLFMLCRQQHAHLAAFQALVQAAPETVTMTDSQHGYSPLHVILKNSQPDMQVIRMLVEANSGVASMTDIDGYTALHHACENQAPLEVIQYLLDAYPRAASVKSRKQDTALHLACGANASSHVVRLLIDANPKALTMSNDYGFTPLHCVCRAYMPRADIVKPIMDASPDCVHIKTHGGETAVHLACSSSAHVRVLSLLTSDPVIHHKVSMSNKVGMTPLHEACFRGVGVDEIETLAKANPEWIVMPNKAGFTPLQVLCKHGNLDSRIITLFSRIKGHQVFTVVDETGHTPLHSACRNGTSLDAIQSLIRAYPGALRLKTCYGDTPLHLACLRGANANVVQLIAESSSDGQVLQPNVAGQTAMSIAMDFYQSNRIGSFEVLAALAKILFYGPNSQQGNLVMASVSLHRQDIRLNPSFIRRAIRENPEQVRMTDDDGNYPLHIEASIPMEKMILLGGDARVSILELLVESYPQALHAKNATMHFPLGLMMQNGREWSRGFAVALRNFPAALHWQEGIPDGLFGHVFSKVSRECGADSVYNLLLSRPDLVKVKGDYNDEK